jgi:hypothetical protein
MVLPQHWRPLLWTAGGGGGPYEEVHLFFSSVAEPHHFYAAPAPGENLDAAPARAPTLL